MEQQRDARMPTGYRKALAILCMGVLAAVGILIMGTTPETAKAELASVAAVDFERFLISDTPTIIDVRTPEEFAAGHLPGAINIDFHDPNFKSNLRQLDRHNEYAIYCRSGNRSSDALALMRSLGFTEVRELANGISGWAATGRDTCTNC